MGKFEKKKHKKDKKKDRKKDRKKEKKRSRGEESIVIDAATGDDVDSPSAKRSRKEVKEANDINDNHNQSRDTNLTSAGERPIVESSAVFEGDNNAPQVPKGTVTLLLFYQYVEPPWSNEEYKTNISHVEQLGKEANITGRMRVAKEGLNCTLSGSRDGILTFCRSLRRWKPDNFLGTEFKLTHDLPEAQRFGELKIIPVQELVHYGLEGEKAPAIAQYQGTHLEPKDYHKKLAQDNTIVIDVRNHYEANIGRFAPPPGAAEWVDPKMRKSTEFPVWLDNDQTKEKMRGKQVLMYCTGGIRCERASALLKYKMENDPAVKDLGIKGVFQLQGGIDKYFKAFPDGGFWKGKNYVFDKRFSHAPPALDGVDNTDNSQKQLDGDQKPTPQLPIHPPMGKCEGCGKAWDKYRGRRRCPTCGVPSLTCRECYQADQDGTRKLDRNVRCDLCVEQNIRSKKDLRMKEQRELADYEKRMKELGLLRAAPETSTTGVPNPNGVTRLYLKNMCKKNMSEDILMEFLPGITHILWRLDRKTKQFFGQGWVEMKTPDDAARAVAKSGEMVLGRPLYVEFQPPDGKDSWPPPSSKVV